MKGSVPAAAAGVGTVVVGGVVLALFTPFMEQWQAWPAATCMPTGCFCEAVRPTGIRQPVNTWSSLGFVFVALLVLFTGYGQSRRGAADRGTFGSMHGLSPYTILLATGLLVVGVGSAFYHASLSLIGQFVDVMGMYAIATFMILHAAGRMRRLSAPVLGISYVGANAMLASLLLAVPEARRYAFAGVLFIALGLEYAARALGSRRLQVRPLVIGLCALAVAFVFWLLDISGVVCHPDSWFQGHAVWHLGGAFAAWQLYRYYRQQ